MGQFFFVASSPRAESVQLSYERILLRRGHEHMVSSYLSPYILIGDVGALDPLDSLTLLQVTN